ncbi:class I SAM-dependent methyltransferase [Cronbergia sp. UHCC 0137]|uniref:O-methyltransferase n=1 Tax=Cronbergia sp. UHCC 0137 TaxID=3110239 RepID=UPI002B20E6B2|nr:class I SAM-dependent methyltransferase [Cronbergia sp. UHCC 0137]MEA5620674.1 class I SAM-dependent methyltransferase [Cronbergia sp. UHCC 0137]
MKAIFKAIFKKIKAKSTSSLIEISALKTAKCEVQNLRRFSSQWLNSVFLDAQANAEWEVDKVYLNALKMPEMTGGVNPGDQRAMYYLVRTLKPTSILEIGTHIGSSTTAMALAAKRNLSDGISTTITTVDINNVNDPKLKPWLNFSSPASPAKLIEQIDCSELVRFETNSSVNFLNKQQSFDLIFLDGDHSASAVYTEIPLALQRLNQDGIIVLHDFFPGGQPLWPGQTPLLGPFLALERFSREDALFQVIPMGELPWPTKLGSCVTSLAILAKI